MATVACVEDFRREARRRLPRFLFDYIDGGANGEHTMRENCAALRRVTPRQRVLRDVATVDLSTELFGRRRALPVALGPIGLTGMYARRGEVQAVRAADARGVPFCLSTVSVCALEEVAAAAAAPFWFQLYMVRDRGFLRDLIARAAAAGCEALVVTVDMPLPGARHRDAHSGMSGPGAARRRLGQALRHPRWAWDVGLRGRPHHLGNIAPVLAGRTGLEDFMGWIARNFDPGVSWRDLAAIRAAWPGPLVVKGVLEVEDAREAVALGADGVVVSNHGGRQLDGVTATARALPAIADAVGDATTVLVDGGVRSGLDVLRMVALGARGVLLGRAWAWALATAGQAGVKHLLDMIAQELRIALALTGNVAVDRLDRSCVAIDEPR